MEDLNNTINKFDILDIHTTLHSKTTEHIFLSTVHKTVAKKKTEIPQKKYQQISKERYGIKYV